VIKVGGMIKPQVLWQAVFLAASPLALGDSAAKNVTSCVPKIPLATKAKTGLAKEHLVKELSKEVIL